MYTYQWGLKAKGSRPAVFKWAKFAWTFFYCVMRKQIRIPACVQNNYHVNYKTPSSKTSTLIISLYIILKYRGHGWIGVVTSMTESRNTYRMLTGKSFGSLCFEYRVQDNNVMRLILRIDGGSKETGLVANGSCISFFGFCYCNVGWLLSMSMGWHYVSELRPPVLISFPQMIGYMSMQNRGGMILTETFDPGEKPFPIPLFPPQIPRELTQGTTRASATSGRRLTAWAMAGPMLVS
jgi:hypothetical protein